MTIPKEFKKSAYRSVTTLHPDGLIHRYQKEVKISKGVTKNITCLAIFARGLKYLLEQIPHGVYVEDVPFASLCGARFSYYKEAYHEGYVPKELTECPSLMSITLEDGTVLTTYFFKYTDMTMGNAHKAYNTITIDEYIALHNDCVVTYDSRNEAAK
jgi:hypothetical protein